MIYLAMDTETGGLDPRTSLLTAYFGVYDDTKLLAELYLEMVPDDGIFHIEPGALEINGIDLVAHSRTAITYKKAGTQLYQFLRDAYTSYGKLTPVGQNVQWDVRRITDAIIHPDSWGSFVSRRVIDTGVVVRFLVSCGKLPEELGSLESIGRHFGLSVAGIHNAKTDAVLSMEVLRALRGMVQQ